MRVTFALALALALFAATADAFFGGGKKPSAPQAAPGAKQVEVTWENNGKTVTANQGEPIANVARRAGVKIKYDCKKGRCGSCEVRLNGRASAKVCQGATIPFGPSKKLKIKTMA
eukprot:CAMPEP_0118887958 /NCGR_PEP_ID=MMETSP1163-20130328/25477_1 /TAXON_ID=124430 /ORGANISM="Phaeomonas parva, Strain CCMP2877" /LENGTH=114 /DNA_ID=CAMNT_0006826517 /DNA_START=27 /DNA_END=371 /DNA_ORIENTATION=-